MTNLIRHAQNCVDDFHLATGSTVGDYPAIRDAELRAKLIAEETGETIAALGLNVDIFLDDITHWSFSGKPDLVATADGIADLLYVTLGTAVACGIDIEPIFAAVHESNMAKVKGGLKRADGKILKGPDWQPPDVEGLLKLQSIGTFGLKGSIHDKDEQRAFNEASKLAQAEAADAGAWS